MAAGYGEGIYLECSVLSDKEEPKTRVLQGIPSRPHKSPLGLVYTCAAVMSVDKANCIWLMGVNITLANFA